VEVQISGLNPPATAVCGSHSSKAASYHILFPYNRILRLQCWERTQAQSYDDRQEEQLEEQLQTAALNSLHPTFRANTIAFICSLGQVPCGPHFLKDANCQCANDMPGALLACFLNTNILCCVFLYFYLGPSFLYCIFRNRRNSKDISGHLQF
jgi:hypothetical protein